jgi:hypothetical protein
MTRRSHAYFVPFCAIFGRVFFISYIEREAYESCAVIGERWEACIGPVRDSHAEERALRLGATLTQYSIGGESSFLPTSRLKRLSPISPAFLYMSTMMS